MSRRGPPAPRARSRASDCKDYLSSGACSFSVHLETSPDFLKILMGIASKKGDFDVMRYCTLKEKQQQARKYCEEECTQHGNFPTHHPTDTQLLHQEKLKQIFIYTESELHALRAKVVSVVQHPEDPGLRVLYERTLAAVRVNWRTVKEIEKFTDPFVYDGMRGLGKTESTKRREVIVQLRCEHFDGLIAHYNGRRMVNDVGAHVVVSWLSRRKRDAFLGTRAWMLKMNDATGRTVALTSTLEKCKCAIHLADSPSVFKVGYNWDWSGQPMSFREEMKESYDLMEQSIANGEISGWSFGLAEKRGDSQTPRIVSETTLMNGRKMAITLPRPLYWRIFFELESPGKIDVIKDAWLGAATLYELTRYHVALIKAGVYKGCCENAWLDVLAYEDAAPKEEAVPAELSISALESGEVDGECLLAAPKVPKAHKAPAAPKPPAAPKLTKREKDQEAARLARQLQEACEAEREKQLAAARKAEAAKKAVADSEREEARKRAEAERIRTEAIAAEEAEAAAQAANEAEPLRVKHLRDARAAAHLEHREAQQKKRDPNATDLQRQLAAEAAEAKAGSEEAEWVEELAKQQREAQAVQDVAYANDHEVRMAAKAADVAAKKAVAKAKKEAEKAAKQAKGEAEAVVAEQRRREELVWAAAQPAPALAPVPSPPSDQASAAPTDCIICMETKATHVIVPCGHFCLCARCARNQNQCPLCRAPAMHIIRGFF